MILITSLLVSTVILFKTSGGNNCIANNDDAQVKELYRQMGMTVKMSGYKWLMRYFDTIVQTGKSPPNNYSFMVYGSRGSRALLNGASQTMISASPNQDFYEQFGKKFLGW